MSSRYKRADKIALLLTKRMRFKMIYKKQEIGFVSLQKKHTFAVELKQPSGWINQKNPE